MNKYIKSIVLGLFCAVILTSSTICTDKVTAQSAFDTTPIATSITNGHLVSPLAVVATQSAYLNKTITMREKFDKFSTLGLDYSVAYRSQEEYISFLIKRDDTKYNIPLSEMKLFLLRKEAEKFVELKTNDEIEITGVVFSDALGDAWIDITKLTVIKKAPEKDGVK